MYCRLFSKTNYATLGDQEEFKYRHIGTTYAGTNGILVNEGDLVEAIPSANNFPCCVNVSVLSLRASFSSAINFEA